MLTNPASPLPIVIAMAVLRVFVSSALALAGAYGGVATDPLDAVTTSSTYQAANSKLGLLESRLQKLQIGNEQALKTHQAMYEANLRSKRAVNVKLAVQNTVIAKKARSWQALNAELHKKAQDYTHDLKLWQRDWEGVRLNITAVMETSLSTLSSFSNYTESPEMQVLHELDSEQAREEATEEHASRLNDLVQPATGTRSALMQTASVRTRPSKSIFKTIEEGMQKMSVDQEKKESKLIGHFFKLFQVEIQRHEVLIREQMRLNATCQNMSDLHTRLDLAITNMQGLNGQLAKRGHAIRAYVERLGTRPMPSAGEREEVLAEVNVSAAPAQVDDFSLPEGGLASLMAVPEAPGDNLSTAAEKQAPRAQRAASLMAVPAAPEDLPAAAGRKGVRQSLQVAAVERLRKPHLAAESGEQPSWLEWWVR